MRISVLPRVESKGDLLPWRHLVLPRHYTARLDHPPVELDIEYHLGERPELVAIRHEKISQALLRQIDVRRIVAEATVLAARNHLHETGFEPVTQLELSQRRSLYHEAFSERERTSDWFFHELIFDYMHDGSGKFRAYLVYEKHYATTTVREYLREMRKRAILLPERLRK